MGLLNERIQPLGYENSALANYQPSQAQPSNIGFLEALGQAFVPETMDRLAAIKAQREAPTNASYAQLAEYWAQRGDPEKAAQYAELAGAQNKQARAFSKVEGVINPETGKKDVAVIDEYGVPKYVGLDLSGIQNTEAPKTREINKGNNIVTQEWNGSGWTDVAVAPRYKPGEGGGGAKPASLSDVLSLGQKFESVIKDDVTVVNGFRNLKANASLGTPQGDIALIYGYMKIQDPTSVVREGEFATAQNAGGLDEKARAKLNEYIGTGRLTPTQRAELIRSAEATVKSRSKQFNENYNRFSRTASQFGIDPSQALSNPYADIEITPQKPKFDRAMYNEYKTARQAAYNSGKYDLVRMMDAEAVKDGLILAAPRAK